MPKVTAIITTFNRSNFLEKAIDSVLSQSFRDFELLILDNSSEDNTKEVVHSFEDSRIKYILHEPIGISEQRNLGLNQAKADFVAFLDDDDFWLPNKLQDQYDQITKSEEIALVYGAYFFFDGDVRSKVFHSKQFTDYFEPLLANVDGFCASASNPMLRLSAAKEVQGYKDWIKSGEDYYLYIELSKKYSFIYVDKCLLAIRDHQGPRLIGRLGDRITLEEEILARFGEELSAKTKLFLLRKIAGKYVRNGDAVKGRVLLWRLLASEKFWLDARAWAQFLLTFAGTSGYSYVHNLLSRRKQRKMNMANEYL